MDRVQAELEHMQKMLEPPFREAFRAYIWDKAKRMSETDAEFSELSRMLAEAIRKSSKANGLTPESTDQPRKIE